MTEVPDGTARAQLAEALRTSLRGIKEVFTLVMPDDGPVYVFNVSAMRAHAERHPGVGYVQGRFELDNAGLQAQVRRAFYDPKRLERLLLPSSPALWEPALGILMDDGKTYIIDGNHRIRAWTMFHLQTGMLRRFLPDAWPAFVVPLPPELTRWLRDDTLATTRDATASTQ